MESCLLLTAASNRDAPERIVVPQLLTVALQQLPGGAGTEAVEEVFGRMKTAALQRKTRFLGPQRAGWLFTFAAAAHNQVRMRNIFSDTIERFNLPKEVHLHYERTSEYPAGRRVTVVDIAGTITLGDGSSAVRNTLRELTEHGHKKILLNLGEVTYIDSSGIGELVAGYTTAARHDATVKLLGLTHRVKDLLQITKLYTVFDVHEDETHAVRSFA